MSFRSQINVNDGVPSADTTVHRLIEDVKSQLQRVPQDINAVKTLANTLLTGGTTDDRKLLLEQTVQWAASYGKDSPAAGVLTNAMLANLWDNLKHPPLSYMGNEFKYRMADGSNNNIMYPNLGKSGSPYARSVVPQRSPTMPLPDPGDVFDQLFARRGIATEHPTKFSSLAIALATIIIHDIFRTDDMDPNRVMSSSYLDLGPLYGHNETMQRSVRTFQDGLLKPDTFAEPRIVGQPPGVGALLVAFGRFHNYVVGELAAINQDGRFTLRPGKDEATAKARRDNDLFQTGRLITCGLYINIILHDYVRVILNLNRSDTTWNLDPRVDFFDPFDGEGTPKGVGNQVSMEFNLIYRWHATTSNKNEAWTNRLFAEVFPGLDPATITQEQLRAGFTKWAHSLDPEPSKWTFGGLKRNAAGAFDNAALITLLSDTTEDVAAAFGARNVPIALRAVEIMGINQGRSWGTASLNEMRKFFNLKPHSTFLEMNPDPEIAASLEALYGHVDNVELYPGLVCEDTKPPIAPGSGLCAGLTVAKAILSDAVALVRGDRFYTVDNSPANLTSFGFNEIASDPNVASGTTIYKLLQRAFPGWYKANSVYALFPLTIPSENRAILKAKGVEAHYDYDRPAFHAPPTLVMSWKGVVDVLNDQKTFAAGNLHVDELIKHSWPLSGDKEWNHKQKALCMHAFYDPAKSLPQIVDYCTTVTNELLRTKSIKARDHYQIDAIRDVGNPTHGIVTAHLFHVPLKDQGGEWTPTQMFEACANMFQYMFLDIDPATAAQVRNAAVAAEAKLSAAVTKSCQAVADGKASWLKSIFGKLEDDRELPDWGNKLFQRILDAGKTVEEVVALLVPVIAIAPPLQGQGIAHLLDFYLSPEQAQHWTAIQELARSDSPEALDQIRKYVLEGLRLSVAAPGALRTVAAPNVTLEDGPQRTLKLAQGSSVFAWVGPAGRDPSVYPDPLKVKLDRDYDKYIHHGWGAHACLGRKIAEQSLPVQLRAFARLKNLRRATGQAGQLKHKMYLGAFNMYMNEDWSAWSLFPASLKLYYDA